MIILVLDHNVYSNFSEKLSNVGSLIKFTDNHISLSNRISLSVIKLQEILLENDAPLVLSTSPVLTILSETIDVLDNIQLFVSKYISPDMIFFDYVNQPTLMYASLAATIKVFKGVNKFNKLFQNRTSINNDVRYQISWYTQRIGFKVYEQRS